MWLFFSYFISRHIGILEHRFFSKQKDEREKIQTDTYAHFNLNTILLFITGQNCDL